VGLAISRKLATAGYRVIALARHETKEFSAAALQSSESGLGALQFIPFDLADIEGIPALVRQIRSDAGPIYGLVNNAAISSEGLLATMHNSQIETLVRVNTLSPIVLTKYVARIMMSSGRGRIVNISSIIASTGYSALSVYGATKASMIGFTKSLSREVGGLGVTVNAVAPGFMNTDMTRALDDEQRKRVARRSALRRLPDVDDVANAVEYLMSDKGRNITGTVITIDAGNTA
jgi:3-oxoacyl-[acyl-carrier protein] reductase